MDEYDGWIIVWRGGICWWTASPTRGAAIAKVRAGGLANGRTWRQMRREGWRCVRVLGEQEEAKP
jgi:hypothetical protein